MPKTTKTSQPAQQSPASASKKPASKTPKNQKAKQSKLPKGIFTRTSDILWIMWTDEHGKQKRVSTGTTDVEIAKTLLQRQRDRVLVIKHPELAAHYEHIARNECGLLDFLQNIYYKSTDAGELKSFESRKTILNKFSRFYCPNTDENGERIDKPLYLLTISDLMEYQRKQIAEGVKPGTMNRHRSHIKVMLKYARDTGYFPKLSYKIIDETDSYRKLTEEQLRRRAFSAADIIKILETAKKSKQCPDLYDVIRIGLLTGLRKSNITKMPWSAVNFEQKLIYAPPKGKGKAIQIIPMSEPLKEVLEARFKNKRCDYVFYMPDTMKPPKNAYRTAWEGLLDKLGIRKKWKKGETRVKENSDIVFHTLRRSFSSHLEDRGTPVTIIQKLLGHAHVSTTERYLAQIRPITDRVDVLNGLGPLVGIVPPPPEPVEIDDEKYAEQVFGDFEIFDDFGDDFGD
ncbi:tyrosine-type recombinase/integrase [Oryzomonas rubra]|uniref:Site-specific integrase n=1 Tax=Oryzomonas rubra TaxID=2509454 RepID=A0A5A9X6V3_9BACT|nr:site-specific integrase [Oryzomonas rubra]KAA0888105.1 site-specific integrase [Oryzomonas rubra]